MGNEFGILITGYLMLIFYCSKGKKMRELKANEIKAVSGGEIWALHSLQFLGQVIAGGIIGAVVLGMVQEVPVLSILNRIRLTTRNVIRYWIGSNPVPTK